MEAAAAVGRLIRRCHRKEDAYVYVGGGRCGSGPDARKPPSARSIVRGIVVWLEALRTRWWFTAELLARTAGVASAAPWCHPPFRDELVDAVAALVTQHGYPRRLVHAVFHHCHGRHVPPGYLDRCFDAPTASPLN